VVNSSPAAETSHPSVTSSGSFCKPAILISHLFLNCIVLCLLFDDLPLQTQTPPPVFHRLRADSARDLLDPTSSAYPSRIEPNLAAAVHRSLDGSGHMLGCRRRARRFVPRPGFGPRSTCCRTACPHDRSCCCCTFSCHNAQVVWILLTCHLDQHWRRDQSPRPSSVRSVSWRACPLPPRWGSYGRNWQLLPSRISESAQSAPGFEERRYNSKCWTRCGVQRLSSVPSCLGQSGL